MPEIVVQNPRRYRSLESSKLRDWLGKVLNDLAPEGDSLGVRFVNDSEMQDLNHQFRNKDYPTDVLSFPGGDLDGSFHVGDIVIAVPTARRQAAASGSRDKTEICTLLLHGVLHCLGYDHETDDGEMDRLEGQLRQRWIRDVD